MSDIHPNQVLADLKSALKSPRAHGNLDLVHAACNAIHERADGVKNYTVPHVISELKKLPLKTLAAARAKGAAGPAATTISQTPGLHFRKLIAAWKEWDTNPAAATVARVPTSAKHENLLLEIPNPATRSQIGRALAEGEKAKADLNTMRAHANIKVDMRMKDGSDLLREAEPGIPLLAPVLLETEKKALHQCLDENYLKGKGLRLGPEGQLLTGKGTLLFGAGWASGLRKSLPEAPPN